VIVFEERHTRGVLVSLAFNVNSVGGRCLSVFPKVGELHGVMNFQIKEIPMIPHY